MRRVATTALIGALLLAGCTPSTSSTPIPKAVVEDLINDLTSIDFAPMAPLTELPNPDLMAELPLFDPPPPPPLIIEEDPWASRPRGDLTDAVILAQLADHLAKTGNPEPPSASFPALYVGKLEGEVYAYDLGNYAFYLLSRTEKGWRPTRICEDEGREIEIVTHQGVPLLACSAMAGTYKLVSLGALYRGEKQLFRIGGIRSDGFQIEPTGGEMPDLTAYQERLLMGIKGGFPVTARYRLTWRDGAYQIAKIEVQEDWGYHLARFMQLWQRGDDDAAAQELAAPPSEGLTAYIEERAPALIRHRMALHYHFPEREYPTGRAYFKVGDPFTWGPDDAWIWFEFDERGRITAIGEEAE